MNNLKTFAGLTLEDAFAQLDAQLESAAYKEIRGGKGQSLGLTDIVPAYLPFTLNKLFGPIGIGWGFSVDDQNTKAFEVEKNDGSTRTEYTSSAKVTVWYNGFDDMFAAQKFVLAERVPGGSSNSTLEWAMKGAVTNALGTAWFFAGWQISVYMDKRGHNNLKDEEERPEKPAKRKWQSSKKEDDGFLDEPTKPEPKPEKQAEPSSEVLAENHGRPGAEFTIPFGFQKGQKIGALPDATVRGALEWAKKNKPREQQDFITAATAFLGFSELDEKLGPRVPLQEQKIGDVTQSPANLKQSIENCKTVEDVKAVVERIKAAFKANALTPTDLDELYQLASEKNKAVQAPKKGKK